MIIEKVYVRCNYAADYASVNTINWKNKNDQYHRKNGPAVEYSNGEQDWYRYGQFHREGGPAITFLNSSNDEYYINGNLVTKEDFDSRNF